MSVTLKLADADARLIGEILTTVVRHQAAVAKGQETVYFLKQLDRLVSPPIMVHHVMELAGAFRTVVRANER